MFPETKDDVRTRLIETVAPVVLDQALLGALKTRLEQVKDWFIGARDEIERIRPGIILPFADDTSQQLDKLIK
jgi:hypothetical protein